VALYKYGAVEAVENDLDAVLPRLTDEQFKQRREILSKYIFPMYEQLEKDQRISNGLD
jgi:hypothetical protein